MKQSLKKKITISVVAILLLLAAGFVGGSFYLLHYALAPKPGRTHVAEKYRSMYKDYPDMRPWIDSLRRAKALRHAYITTPEGLRLHALYVPNPRANGRTAIVVHGYTDSSIGMLPLSRIYSRYMGYNILLPDLPAHGLSQGDHIQMGWADRLAVIQWLPVAERLFRVPGHKSQMVVHGVSMGAATTMNVSGEKCPPYVRCFVEDCGYTSAWDEFAYKLKDQFHLPAFPLLYGASALCKIKYGWSFKEASPLKQLARRHTPMMFIHGTNDNYVPSPMVLPLYNANEKDPRGRFNEIWITKGCAHANSYHDYPEEYARRVKAFVTQYVK